MRHQGRAEGDGLFGRTQPLHLAAGGESTTTIPAPEESRVLYMDRQGRRSSRQSQEDAQHHSDPCAPLTRKTSPPLCHGSDPGRQCRSGGSKARRGACDSSSAASLLHQRGALGNKGTIPLDPNANLRCDSRSTQATALLSRPSDHGGLVLSARRDHLESRGHGEDREMVGRAHGGGPHVCTSQGYQFLGAG